MSPVLTHFQDTPARLNRHGHSPRATNAMFTLQDQGRGQGAASAVHMLPMVPPGAGQAAAGPTIGQSQRHGSAQGSYGVPAAGEGHAPLSIRMKQETIAPWIDEGCQASAAAPVFPPPGHTSTPEASPATAPRATSTTPTVQG